MSRSLCQADCPVQSANHIVLEQTCCGFASTLLPKLAVALQILRSFLGKQSHAVEHHLSDRLPSHTQTQSLISAIWS